jgi:hypothetical protein
MTAGVDILLRPDGDDPLLTSCRCSARRSASENLPMIVDRYLRRHAATRWFHEGLDEPGEIVA